MRKQLHAAAQGLTPVVAAFAIGLVASRGVHHVVRHHGAEASPSSPSGPSVTTDRSGASTTTTATTTIARKTTTTQARPDLTLAIRHVPSAEPPTGCHADAVQTATWSTERPVQGFIIKNTGGRAVFWFSTGHQGEGIKFEMQPQELQSISLSRKAVITVGPPVGGPQLNFIVCQGTVS
ncbi:hypothetical protein [Aquihabitans sp. McL0605]|uniref:hypothetical protein n=1 Tax=Aquihabitans sp. McL0605 TaxID=3415671 RepID=UPI003CEDAE45